MFENPKQRAKLFLAFTLIVFGTFTPLFSNRIFKIDERLTQERIEKTRAKKAQIIAIEEQEEK